MTISAGDVTGAAAQAEAVAAGAVVDPIFHHDQAVEGEGAGFEPAVGVAAGATGVAGIARNVAPASAVILAVAGDAGVGSFGRDRRTVELGARGSVPAEGVTSGAGMAVITAGSVSAPFQMIAVAADAGAGAVLSDPKTVEVGRLGVTPLRRMGFGLDHVTPVGAADQCDRSENQARRAQSQYRGDEIRMMGLDAHRPTP